MAENKAYNQTSAGMRQQKTAKVCEHMAYAAREAFKRLRTNVLITLEDMGRKGCRAIGVTSAQPSEGKSTVSINLAYTLAEQGKSVILLDCDLRRPSIHTNLNVRQSPGMTEIMEGHENLDKAMLRYKSSENETCFDLITAGALPRNPSEILGSKRFYELLDVLRNAYDVIILDLPPTNVVIDAAVVAKATDGLLVVIRENHCTRFVLQDCMEQLAHAKANVLGFVVNGSVNGAGKRYRYGKGYHYDNAYYEYKK